MGLLTPKPTTSKVWKARKLHKRALEMKKKGLVEKRGREEGIKKGLGVWFL